MRLKKHLSNIIVTRSMTGIAGQVTFDANKVKKDDYQWYVENGFADLFEEDLPSISTKTSTLVDKIKTKKK